MKTGKGLQSDQSHVSSVITDESRHHLGFCAAPIQQDFCGLTSWKTVETNSYWSCLGGGASFPTA